MVQWIYLMSNPLMCCHSQRVLLLLDTNVEFMEHLLRRNDRVSGISLHCLDIHVPNFYDSDELFCHRSLHKHISYSAHGSVGFDLANIWSPRNIKYFTYYLLLLSLYRRQYNRLRIPLCFTYHDNVSALFNITLCCNS